MKRLSVKDYEGLEGEILCSRADVLTEELGIPVMSIGARLSDLADNGVPVYEVKTMSGELGTRKTEEHATDMICFRYLWDGKPIIEIWEGIVEHVEEINTDYTYLICHVATLN